MVSPKEHGVLGTAKTEPFGRKDTHAPSSPFEIEKTKKPWSKRVKVAIAGLAALSVLGGAAAADQQGLVEIPGIHQIIDNDNGARPFDIDKLDKAPQTVVDGINARPVTAEEIRDTINSPKLEIDLNKIRTVADLPEVSILLSIDMQKAGKVEVWKLEGPLFLNGKMVSVHNVLGLSIENANTPMGTPIPEGVNVNTAEIFLMTPSKVGEELHFNNLFVKFDLGNNMYALIDIGSNNLLSASDLIKNAPVIDPDHPRSDGNYLKDIIQQRGLTVSLNDISELFKTLQPNDNIFIRLEYYSTSNGTTALPNPQNENGNLLFSVPR